MEIPKDKIIEMIKQHGHADQAGEAEQELPDQVDPERDSGLLSKFGLEPKDLLGKLGGGLPGL
jgi:predicted Rdx family selenoprotein